MSSHDVTIQYRASYIKLSTPVDGKFRFCLISLFTHLGVLTMHDDIINFEDHFNDLGGEEELLLLTD